MKTVRELSPDVLKKVRVSELTENEMHELRSLVSQFGDVTLLGDKATLYQIYTASAIAKKKTNSVMKKRIADGMEKFVVSAAASRRLHFRQYREQRANEETFGRRLQDPEDGEPKRRRKRIGEFTIIKK